MFHEMTASVVDTHFAVFAEPCSIHPSGSQRDTGTGTPVRAVVSVQATEQDTQTSKQMILRATALLKSADSIGLTTTQAMTIRGQFLKVETVSPEIDGSCKVTLTASKKEHTSYVSR